MANPIKTWTTSLHAGSAVGNASVTVTFHITQAFEAILPIGVVYGSAVSLPAAILAYPSYDGGTTFTNEPLRAYAIPAVLSTTRQFPIVLTTGQWAVEMRNSGPSATFFIFTQEIITAIS